ncbi:MAG: ABC transporter ATP-binding protein [Acidimicrobiaceae bacterium]|nr:ABC transporter ATP-binding protein [Acidimicrobiaceae bacterium]MYH00919.1 ABC transporter ATP-binding protein [Acidimicrobiaceae bacterium]
MAEPLLLLDDVSKVFRKGRGSHIAVHRFNLELTPDAAEIVTIAGESGSGKTTIAEMMLGIIQPTSGRLEYRGRPLADLTRRQRKAFRREVQPVFQDPFASFNPFYRVRHVLDVVIRNFSLEGGTALIDETLEMVGLDGSAVLNRFPHELSGGQRQRIMMARAYMLRPRIIVADEPVSMVDASLRTQILSVMQDMRDAAGISFVYITHDLGTAYSASDRMFVLYRGATMESGPTRMVIDNATHPYTRQLVDSTPTVSRPWTDRIEPLDEAALAVDPRRQCPFAPRCPVVFGDCTRGPVEPRPVGEDHSCSCLLCAREAT